MEDVEEALQICSNHPREERLRAEALRVKGVNLYIKGELRNSLTTLQDSLSLYRAMRENLDAAKVLAGSRGCLLRHGEPDGGGILLHKFTRILAEYPKFTLAIQCVKQSWVDCSRCAGILKSQLKTLRRQ